MSGALGVRADQMKTKTMTKSLPISIEDVRSAAEILSGQIERTPMRHSKTLSEITGAEGWVKFENLQFTAAFKERGALNKLARLTDEQKEAGVVAASAGNHAQGVAAAARMIGIPAVIVMPEDAQSRMEKEIRMLKLAVGEVA